jgi:hypothetical protein
VKTLGKILLIILIIFLAVLLVGDLVVKSIAENRMESAMQSSLELSSRPEVTIKGWPFFVKAVQGNFASVIVVADGVRAQGIDLRDVRLQFDNVRFSLSKILSGDERRVRVGRGQGTASITAAELTSALIDRDVPATVDINNGRVVVNSSELDVEAAAGVGVDSGQLLITPEGGLETLEFALPAFTEGVTYTSARIEGSRIIVEVEIGPTTLVF